MNQKRDLFYNLGEFNLECDWICIIVLFFQSDELRFRSLSSKDPNVVSCTNVSLSKIKLQKTKELISVNIHSTFLILVFT